MSIIVREYHTSDYSGLIALLGKVYGAKTPQDVLEKQYLTASRSILVAADERGEIVGSTFVEIQEDFIRPGRVAFVTYVAVDEQCRKQGIGRKLMLSAEEIGKANNCSAIELTSADFRVGAHAFYASLGFTKKKTTVFIREL